MNSVSVNSRLRFLILAATFPPRGGSSVQRVAKFAKYAKRFGHEPIVVTTSYQGKLCDPSLVADLPQDLEVHRVAPDPANLGRFGRLLARYSYPDRYRTWGHEALHKCEGLIRSGPIEAIFVSFGAPSALFVGAKLARRHRLPLILDIRDMWTITEKATGRNRPGTWLGRIDRMLERRAWKAVSHFTVVSNGYRQTMIEEYGVAPERVTTIYNGFDSEDFRPDTSIGGPKQPSIRFAGFVTEMFGFTQLVSAVAHINERRRQADETLLQLEILGANDRNRLAAALPGPWPDWLILHDYRPHDEAIRFMQQATILALFQPADRGMLTGKFFEYVGAQRPILHLDNRTDELRELITTYALGLSVPQTDTAAIASAIQTLLDGQSQSPVAPPEQFRRDAQARQFLEVLRHPVRAPTRETIS